jgi:hypothetical protein
MRKIILTLTIIIIHLTGFSQTNVSGFLTTNTVWDSLSDPYIITGNVLVTDSVKLTIQPGTVVKFNSQKALQIDGELNVLGTDSARVTFTANTTNPTNGFWDAIIFTASSKPSLFDASGNYLSGSFIENADLKYGGYLVLPNNNNDAIIQGSNVDLYINKCHFSNSGSSGIKIVGNSSNGETYITNNEFNNCDITFQSHYNNKNVIANKIIGQGILYYISGISASSSNNIKVKENVLRNCPRGIYIYGVNIGEISNNIVINENIPTSTGISHRKYTTYSSMVIHNNLVIGDCENIFDNNLVNNNVFVGNSRAIRTQSFYFPLTTNFHQNQIIDCNSANSSIIYLDQWINASGGLYLFSENLFEGNSVNYSFGLFKDYEPNSSLQIHNNNFIENQSQFLLINDYSTVDIGAQNNYWGTINNTTIDNYLYDWFDDASLSFIQTAPILTSPDTSAPISRPKGIELVEACNGPIVFWNSNLEADIKGYKIHYGDFNGYEFENIMDLGDTNIFDTQFLSAYDTIAITAYDNLADDNNDLTEGHESWYRFVNLNSAVKQLDLSNLNNNTFCEGDTILLTAGNSYNSYLWSTSDTTNSIYISTPGNYHIVVTDTNGISYCDTIQMEWQNINLDLGPDTALPFGQTIVLNAYYPWSTYLWDDGSTASSLTVDSSGTYWVHLITPIIGCEFHDSITISFYVGIEENDLSKSLSLYPNPTDNYITIDLNETFAEINVSVIDITGIEVINKDYTHEKNIQLGLDKLVKGIYIVHILADNRSTRLKIIKE